jgi:hypothetical protein
MLIIRGAYHLWPKRVAFRNDYCLKCKAPRRSVAVRSFDVGHIFWIPLLPVGFWRHWTCSVCGKEPHASRKLKRALMWRGLFILIPLSIAFWAIPADRDFAIGSWICRILAPAAAAVLLVQLIRIWRQPSLRTQLATIPAAADTVCPFCGTALATGTSERWSCPHCGVVRY